MLISFTIVVRSSYLPSSNIPSYTPITYVSQGFSFQSVMTICRQLRDLYKREIELVDLEDAYARSRLYKILQIKLGHCINDEVVKKDVVVQDDMAINWL